jgi:hypothetical protein
VEWSFQPNAQAAKPDSGNHKAGSSKEYGGQRALWFVLTLERQGFLKPPAATIFYTV